MKGKKQERPFILHGDKVRVFDKEYEKTIDEIIKEKMRKAIAARGRGHELAHFEDKSLKLRGAADKDLKLGRKEYLGVEIFRESDKPEVRYYKYELPIPNIDPQIEGLKTYEELQEESIVTPNMEVWELLKLDKASSFEDYLMRVNETYKYEVDMYGESTSKDLAVPFDPKNYQELIPLNKLQNTKYMENLHKCFTLNINFPGCMENEHPHRFLAELRPIEEFRNTPLIPISDKQMSDFQKRLENYHRGQFFFEVKKDTIYTYALFGMSMFIVYKILKTIMDKEEQLGIAYERTKLKRLSLIHI
eukprot:TRINITY_DN704_c0_g1_i16.p1 TRINITY_DN704_c0_g1~~TRINITY_DN704_c0_g1_i16.p1  ORF type:complete len:304 (-),score=70.71 TRINITY_DN704_c0_g1_i16:63-974(-)